MPVTTISAAIHITPVVIHRFFAHSREKITKIREGTDGQNAKDDIFYDQAFHIVKAFIELGIQNTVESLQQFTNTRVPVPYWNAVAPVRIPFQTCNQAADLLISWFDPEELKAVVGGERWWQVRGLDGIDAEWVTEDAFLNPNHVDIGRKLSDEDQTILRMDHLESVMLYIHGGGYFWGSINTHRYQISRYARKFRGRAFAVNYRKAPQYPWPCPLQDCLAAYLYLIDPPVGALHKPVLPSKIVVAGDSAGGGLSLTLLTILRDLGLPMPAGAVLISPWVDLTHSFPSVMANTQTDIIPECGFLAKPSTTWPLDPIPPEGGRIIQTKSNPPPKPGHADTLEPAISRVEQEGEPPNSDSDVQSQQTMLKGDEPDKDRDIPPSSNVVEAERVDTDEWEPKPPKILMKDPKQVPLELRSQIQIYATTEQLTHPLVSPIMQGSLGNLPPLYILAGNDEVLRDEIIYLAHRAGHPEEYPLRKSAIATPRQKENATKFTNPTKVHLQVFDGMPHVLTVFSFTESAKYAYRSIAEFVKHVTQQTPEHIDLNPFPELHRPPSVVSLDPSYKPKSKGKKAKILHPDQEQRENIAQATDIQKYLDSQGKTVEAVQEGTGIDVHNLSSQGRASQAAAESSGHDIPHVGMIRQRVDIHGHVRVMEPADELAALKLKPSEIGLIKEDPALRWLKGQEEWDRRFQRQALQVLKRRQKMEAKCERLLQDARDQGLVLKHDGNVERIPSAQSIRTTNGVIQEDRRWGPLDLDDENPPRSAICKRRDTPEAFALLKKHIFWAAPSTHLSIPKQKTAEAIRASFDPRDDPLRPPKQSVSEQQHRTHIIPIHGLRMWDGILGYFTRKSATKAMRGKERATAAVRAAGEHISEIASPALPASPRKSEETKA